MDNTPGRVGGASSDEDMSRTREIREEIDQTREELSETIDAIQEKIKPRNIAADATDRVRQAATERVRNMAYSAGDTAEDMISRTRDTAGDMMEGARQNPVPIALIGLGAAWLLMNRSRSSGSRYDSWVDSESGRRSRARALSSDRPESYDDSVARDYRRRSTGGLNRIQQVTRQYPLLVSAGAMVVGAAVGLAIPETDRENEWMGEARDTVVDRAQEMARNAASSVQEVAGDAATDVVSRVVSGTKE